MDNKLTAGWCNRQAHSLTTESAENANVSFSASTGLSPVPASKVQECLLDFYKQPQG